MKIRLRMHGNAEFPGKLRGRIMKKIFESLLNEMPLGAMVFDEKMRVLYHNSTADKFLKRYGIVQGRSEEHTSELQSP
jgi:c-di-AMP phosphodiesterase-like protein